MPRTILILSSTPRDMAPLRVTEQVQEIEEAIRRSRYRDEYQVVVRLGTRARDVHRVLLEHRPAIVHFAGDAYGEQGVAVEAGRGDSLLVSSASLAEMLGHRRHETACVLLNACHSKAQMNEISKRIPFVIGMNASLDDRAAVSFSTAFYDSLANGESITSAYELACSAVSVHGVVEGRIAVSSSGKVDTAAQSNAQAPCEESSKHQSLGSPQQPSDWSTITFAASNQARGDGGAEFVSGGDLQDAVLAGRIPREQAVPIILRVGEAVSRAHARGHVHGDIKPANILITASEDPRLPDFDLATALDKTGGTRTGSIDKLIYAAPEMMERPQDADARADVYGLGMTAAFMLYGKSLPRKALIAREQFIEEICCHPSLQAVLKRATAEAPEERYPDVAAFCDGLREATSFDTLVDKAASRNVAGTSSANASPPHLVGNYRLLHCIGAGGVGTVYEAIHDEMGKRVAVKILREEQALEWRHVKRFINEARAASHIHHPGIIDVYDAGLFGRNWCLVMELLEGRDLAATLRDDIRQFPESAALHVIRQVGSAMAAAHAKGIVHRDIKPSNIFLVRNPEGVGGTRIKLLDFGLAKLIRPGGGDLTETGVIMGTPRYMSPEQCRGAADEVDHRSDLYSLGIVLFEMLCGRHPFPGRSSGGYIAAHLTEPVPPVQAFAPHVSANTAAIVADLLAKSPNARIASAQVFLERLSESQPE